MDKEFIVNTTHELAKHLLSKPNINIEWTKKYITIKGTLHPIFTVTFAIQESFKLIPSLDDFIEEVESEQGIVPVKLED